MPLISQIVQPLTVMVAVVITLCAVYTDCRRRIIKNSLTFPAIAAGLVLQTLGNGWIGLLAALAGVVVGAGLMMIPFVFGQMGAGDVKLMAALGSLLGPLAVLNVFLYTTLAGGFIALGFAFYHRDIAHTFARVWSLTRGVFVRKDDAAAPLLEQSVTMPYGLAIGVGTFLYLAAGRIV